MCLQLNYCNGCGWEHICFHTVASAVTDGCHVLWVWWIFSVYFRWYISEIFYIYVRNARLHIIAFFLVVKDSYSLHINKNTYLKFFTYQQEYISLHISKNAYLCVLSMFSTLLSLCTVTCLLHIFVYCHMFANANHLSFYTFLYSSYPYIFLLTCSVMLHVLFVAGVVLCDKWCDQIVFRWLD